MVDVSFEGWFEDRSEAGRWLRDRVLGVLELEAAVVVVLTDGGAEVAAALVGPGGSIRRIESFAGVGRLPLDAELVLLVDDGERSPEELAAVAWALLAARPRELAVVVPVASRWLEAALPVEVRVHTARRYTPSAIELFLYAEDERRFEGLDLAPPRERRPLPARTGRPWEAEEEERLDALVSEGLPVPDIAERLGRTRGGVVARIARRAIERGARAAEEAAAAPVSG